MSRRAKNLTELFRGSKKRHGPKDAKLMTAISFDAEELAAVAEYIAAGITLLKIEKPSRGVAKFKAAMSRLKLTLPRAL